MVESAGVAPASTACKAAALLLSYDPDLNLDEMLCSGMVEPKGIEPFTSCLPDRRSPE